MRVNVKFVGLALLVAPPIVAALFAFAALATFPRPQAPNSTPCIAGQLEAAIVGSDARAGHSVDWVAIYNIGSTPCGVTGPTRLELLDAARHVVARSRGGKPFILANPQQQRGPFVIQAGTSSNDWATPNKARIAFVSVSQGPCPGGVFPSDGLLILVLPDAGRIPIVNFTGALAFGLTCDSSAGRYPQPSGSPELLVSSVGGTSASVASDES